MHGGTTFVTEDLRPRGVELTSFQFTYFMAEGRVRAEDESSAWDLGMRLCDERNCSV